MSEDYATVMEAGRSIFGISFSRTSLDELVDELLAPPERGQGARLVVTANVDHVVQLRQNPGLQAAYAHAWRRTIDGFPVYLYARARGVGVEEKVTGADLFPILMERFDAARHRPFFVCADEGIAQGLKRWLIARGMSAEAIGYAVPPFRFEQDEAYSDWLANAIRTHRTTHLLFGVGCPKSEIWIDRHRDKVGDVYACAVGAALAFFTGFLTRAPYPVRRAGFEWLWRALQEPNRLLKRYFFHSWGFVAAVADDLRKPASAVDQRL
ncbi:MAG: WecB/TagA/CpsF family glycosyltransferase [Sphingobium sp.]